MRVSSQEKRKEPGGDEYGLPGQDHARVVTPSDPTLQRLPAGPGPLAEEQGNRRKYAQAQDHEGREDVVELGLLVGRAAAALQQRRPYL